MRISTGLSLGAALALVAGCSGGPSAEQVKKGQDAFAQCVGPQQKINGKMVGRGTFTNLPTGFSNPQFSFIVAAKKGEHSGYNATVEFHSDNGLKDKEQITTDMNLRMTTGYGLPNGKSFPAGTQFSGSRMEKGKNNPFYNEDMPADGVIHGFDTNKANADLKACAGEADVLVFANN